MNTKDFADTLINKYGFSKFCGVPCSNLKYLINYLTNLGLYEPMANEGDCIAYAVGQRLTGTKVAVLMQNSGFSNALSPILSLAKVYDIPLTLIIGDRGGSNDEPQHLYTREFVYKSCMDLRYKSIEFFDDFDEAYDITYNRDSLDNTVIFIRKGVLTEELLNVSDSYSEGLTNRSDVLDVISNYREPNDIVVTTTGFTSREMYDRYDNDLNFYMVGSMGCASILGKGIIDGYNKGRVFVIDGDGAVAMRPNSVLSSYINDNINYVHIIIDNNCYESTGKQPSVDIDLFKMCSSLVEEGSDRSVFSVDNKYQLDFVLSKYLGEIPITVIVNSNSCKNNKLGRPKESSLELVHRFTKKVGEINENSNSI